MACFTVPLVAAAAVSAAKPAIPKSAESNPFVRRLDWLSKMMFGGSFLLAIEHWYHGEITLMPPFLTAAKEGPEAIAEVLREMATRGTAMALILVAAWAAMVTASIVSERKTAARSHNV